MEHTTSQDGEEAKPQRGNTELSAPNSPWGFSGHPAQLLTQPSPSLAAKVQLYMPCVLCCWLRDQQVQGAQVPQTQRCSDSHRLWQTEPGQV